MSLKNNHRFNRDPMSKNRVQAYLTTGKDHWLWVQVPAVLFSGDKNMV